MSLVSEEFIAFISFCGCNGWIHRQVADEFNNHHPGRNSVTNAWLKNLKSLKKLSLW